MAAGTTVSPDEFFDGYPTARAVYDQVCATLAGIGPFRERITKSQVAFRRRRGFAYLWMPGRYLAEPAAEVVLSIALGRQDGSSRFKEVAHPAPHQWMHHLEVRRAGEVDDEVADWLREAADRAG
jgi:hypothetical protein